MLKYINSTCRCKFFGRLVITNRSNDGLIEKLKQATWRFVIVLYKIVVLIYIYMYIWLSTTGISYLKINAVHWHWIWEDISLIMTWYTTKIYSLNVLSQLAHICVIQRQKESKRNTVCTIIMCIMVFVHKINFQQGKNIPS